MSTKGRVRSATSAKRKGPYRVSRYAIDTDNCDYDHHNCSHINFENWTDYVTKQAPFTASPFTHLVTCPRSCAMHLHIAHLQGRDACYAIDVLQQSLLGL